MGTFRTSFPHLLGKLWFSAADKYGLPVSQMIADTGDYSAAIMAISKTHIATSQQQWYYCS